MRELAPALACGSLLPPNHREVAQTAGVAVCGFSLGVRSIKFGVRGSEGILTRSMIKPQRRLSSRTLMKKYRLERKGRRSFDTALEYDTARMMVNEKTQGKKRRKKRAK